MKKENRLNIRGALLDTNQLKDYLEKIASDHIIQKESDNRKLNSLYRLLGKLNNDKAAQILIDSYNSGKNMRSSIM